MKIQYNNCLVSIIIANFNNEKFLIDCLNSIFNQNYKNKEIIVVDDNSTDNSLRFLNSYKKKITILKNKDKKSNHGSYNQINAYYKGYLKSKGKYICFLDSDDYFKKDKIKSIVTYFENNKKINVVYDLPILKYDKLKIKKKFKQKKFILSSWPRFTSQSCISVKRIFINELFKYLKVNKFETIWFDFRIACYCFLKEGKLNILSKYLTYYRQLNTSASSNFKFFSKNWWYRRNQAHDFVSYLSNKLKRENKFTADKFVTKLVNLINE